MKRGVVMDLKPLHLVTLPNDVIDRCMRFGCDVVLAYRSGQNANSLSVSSHGAELNPYLQAQAKAGECAACHFFGLPIDCLNWRNRPDAGHDLIFAGRRIDVKTIDADKRFLIWPVRKINLFASKQFDLFVLVCGTFPQFVFEVAGFISKSTFAARHRVADDRHALAVGTWYMDRNELLPIADLLPPPVTASDAIADRRQFEYISS